MCDILGYALIALTEIQENFYTYIVPQHTDVANTFVTASIYDILQKSGYIH